MLDRDLAGLYELEITICDIKLGWYQKGAVSLHRTGILKPLWRTNGMKNEIGNSKGQFLVYKAEDGTVKIDVKLSDEKVWLT